MYKSEKCLPDDWFRKYIKIAHFQIFKLKTQKFRNVSNKIIFIQSHISAKA